MGASSDRTVLHCNGRAVPLRVRRDARARRIVLRIDSLNDGAVVTVPARVPVREGLRLAHDKADWILDRLARLPPRIPFADGAVVPLRGNVCILRHDPIPSGRGVVRRDGDMLWIAGRPEHLARRFSDWLKREARREIAALVAAKTATIGLRQGRIALRDTRSLWGSCSAKGDFSFCWRLILAPPFVLDYVVAHEVAHLKVRGHGPSFWRAVAALTDQTEAARAWLNREGEALHRYGGAPGFRD